MRKNLSALGLLWISLTSMIGSGWLLGSLYSAHFAGPAAILAWPLAGFLLAFIALAYAEVATMFPQADSLACLPLYTHGRLTSLIMSGLAWLSLATIPAIETQGLVQYASNYLPGLMIQEGLHYTNTALGYVFTLFLLASFILLNYFGLRFFARINATFTIWKLVIPALTIIVLLSFNYNAKAFTEAGGFMPYGWKGVMAAMSSGGVLFSLLGFRQVVIMMSEIQNPGKYVPLVLLSSLVLTTLVYTGLQWAFIGSMRSQDLLQGWAHLSFPGDAGPFAALATLAGLGWLSVLLYLDAFISPYSTGLVYSTTASHMLASMAEIQEVPPILAVQNNYQVPYLSLFINFLLAALMLFVLGGWQAMAAFLVAVLMISYALGPLCLLCLRKQLPSYPRPFRLRAVGFIAFSGFYICTAGVYWAGLSSVLLLLRLTILGTLFYFVYNNLKKAKKPLDLRQALWLFCYLIGLGIFSYYGNYGDNHYLPLYWDLLYLMIFSAFIFALAYLSKKPSSFTQQLVSRETKGSLA